MPEYITDDINIFPEDSDREDCDKKTLMKKIMYRKLFRKI